MARERQLGLLRDAWLPFSLLAGATIGVAASIQLVVHGWAGGFVFGAIVGGMGGASGRIVSQTSGSGRAALGASAEDWTASEVRRLVRSGWAQFRNVGFEEGDVDLLLVGNGNVFVIETKWASDGWRLRAKNAHLARAVAQTAREAWRVGQLINHDDASVVPVLVLWGGCDTSAATHDGVHVVSGHALRDWLHGHAPGALDAQETDAAVARVVRHVEAQRRYVQRNDRGTLYEREGIAPFVAAALGGTCGLVITVASLGQFDDAPLLGVGGLGTALALAHVLRRRSTTALAGSALSAGMAGSLLAFVGCVAALSLA